MGLLDALFSGGADNGLLGFLQNSGASQQPMQGLSSDQAQYGGLPMNAMAQMPPAQMPPAPIFAQGQPNPMDSAQWPYGPNGAPSQANAQMAPVAANPPAVIQAPPAAPPGPSFGDRLMAGVQGFSNENPGGVLQHLANGIGSFAAGRRTDPVGAAQQQAAQVQNLTLQALIQKGVDPVAAHAAIGNPEMLKALITQAYGPQTVQSIGGGYVADKSGKITRAYEPEKTPMSIGNGYIYDPRTKQTIRAYEPEDKIPAGFVKGDDGNMHFIPGGPADPAYIQLAEAKKKDPNGVYTLGRGGELYKIDDKGNPVIVHKNDTPAEPMDPAALEILARREIGGDFSGRKNLGRGAQGASDLKAITNKSSEILTKEMGKTPTEAAAHMLKQQQEYNAQGQGLNAEARTTGVREANLNLILKATAAAIPAALEASEKVSRTGWVPLNKIVQAGQVASSDKDLRQFGMANIQLAEHWARAMNPTGVMRGEDRDLALGFLGTADSKETYRALVGQLQKQIERERDAVKSSRGMAGMPGAETAHTSPSGAPAPGAYVWSPDKGVAPK